MFHIPGAKKRGDYPNKKWPFPAFGQEKPHSKDSMYMR
jgi:hypothetical protein